MFVINLNYLKPLEIVDQYLVEHRNYLEQGYQKNYFIASGPKNPRTGGIILSQLTDRNLLENIIKDDPFYKNHIASFDITEFSPVKFHEKFNYFVS